MLLLNAGLRATAATILLRSKSSPSVCHGGGLSLVAKAPSCILVVDDLDDVRDTAVAVLEAAGYVVVAAGSGEASLALLGAQPEPDLLFTDVVLGSGLNGFEVAQRAARLRPLLKILSAT